MELAYKPRNARNSLFGVTHAPAEGWARRHTGNLDFTQRFPCAVAHQTGGGSITVGYGARQA